MKKNLLLIVSCSLFLVPCTFSQNVGIGTPNPQNKLHVAGGFRLDTLTGVGGAGLLWHNPNGVVYGLKFTGNTNDVLRGDGSFGPTSSGGIGYWSANGNHIYNNNTGNVGIGTTTPGSGFELRGIDLKAQQRVTDNISGNSLVLQGGSGSNLKVTGYNYTTGTAQPLYLSVDGANTIMNPNGGNVGIGTNTPASPLTVNTPFSPFGNYGIEHTNGVVRLSTFLNGSGGWIGTKSNHPLHFYTNDGSQQMTLTQSGQVGIGTTAPLGGYLLDVAGPVKSFGNTTHFVAQTTGGTNSWARYYMRSSAQSWFMGTSQNFNGNQLYIADETYNQTRFSIQPNGGPINLQGNTTQNLGGYGQPKAMLYVTTTIQGNLGTIQYIPSIDRCYNGVTGGASNGCGFSVTFNGNNYTYEINLGFSIDNRFISITPYDVGGSENDIKRNFYIANNSGGNLLYIHAEHIEGNGSSSSSHRPIGMMVIIY